MTTQEIMSQLEAMGNESTKKTLMKHGAKEPFFGVKVEDLKKIVKIVKKDYKLSLELYATGNSDAMYLAGLIADEKKMTKEDLNNWVKGAYWYYISEFTVPWVAAESAYGIELAKEWLNSTEETKVAAAWGTFSYTLSVKNDDEIDFDLIFSLLEKVEKEIHQSQNRVKYAMNSFVISVGSYYKPLAEKAMKVAEQIGKVNVILGSTACKVPLATEYIEKTVKRTQFKKRKSARC
jgi:3-methyladenine DNA glycosylase AlkD